MKKALVTAALLLFTAACSSIVNQIDLRSLSDGNGQNQPQTRLSIWLYPATGLEDLISQYEKLHPNIKVDIFTSQFEDVHNNLQTAFASGSGAPDICLIEVSFIERFKAFPDYFHNLLDFGAGQTRDKFLDWKWQQAESADHRFVFGLPTDIGPMALVYRPDIFARAGLPTNRDELARNMRTWDDFLEMGKIINERTGKAMIDNLSTFYQTILGQAERQYFDRATGNLIIETNPAVKSAWNYAIEAHKMGISAGFTTWKPDWASALDKGEFAVLLSPSWMLNYLKSNAPATSGQWDVTLLPEGSGNRGGSFLTLPKEGKHPGEAFALIRWLTAPEQQLVLYQTRSNFPSSQLVYEDPNIRGKKDPFFGDAPVGQLFSAAATQVKPTYEGPYQFVVTSAMEAELYKLERGETTPEQAWNEAMELVHKQLAKYDVAN